MKIGQKAIQLFIKLKEQKKLAEFYQIQSEFKYHRGLSILIKGDEKIRNGDKKIMERYYADKTLSLFENNDNYLLCNDWFAKDEELLKNIAKRMDVPYEVDEIENSETTIKTIKMPKNKMHTIRMIETGETLEKNHDWVLHNARKIRVEFDLVENQKKRKIMKKDEIDNEDNDNEDFDIPQEQRKIVHENKDFPISHFCQMESVRELILQPEYQRNFIASKAIASKLIESILVDIPIPSIYLAEEKDGNYEVIDGQQRLTSFISYVKGSFPDGSEFKLNGLRVCKELNGKKFSEIDPVFQKKIKNTTIRSIIIKKESNEDMKFEIFERLNTGSIKLNDDEIRNTVYRGDYIKLLKELSENPAFHAIVNKDDFKKRMGYRRMVLRFLALSERSYMNYKSSMKQFLNKELRDNRNINNDKALEYKKRFEKCLDLVNTVFGKNAFRRYIPGDNETKGGNWTANQINMALFDLQMIGFVNYTKNEVLANADAIREGLLDLMITDTIFQELIGYKTSNTDNVKKRFKIYMEFLEKVIGDKSYQERIFPYKIKEELFANNPYCAISNQRILAIEDAEVDHIIPYSKGGKTVKENAQLVLRYFNRQKKDN